ncbi:MAG: hypothetical protein JWR83_345, partial [Aeromicrobium sp.]|nr:hypothetical protein [Aeromicrobium sp.]
RDAVLVLDAEDPPVHTLSLVGRCRDDGAARKRHLIAAGAYSRRSSSISA